MSVKKSGISQSTSILTGNYSNQNNFISREIHQNSIFALSTSISRLESIGNPQFATSNSTGAAEVTIDTTMIKKRKYKEECESEIVNCQSLSIQNEVYSVNFDEEIFEDAEFVKNLIANISRNDNPPQEHARVSNNEAFSSILTIDQNFGRLGNEIGVVYNEIAFPNYDETLVGGIPMNRINPFSRCAQNNQNMFLNARLRNTTPILPIQENEPNCILRYTSLNSVKMDQTENISSLRYQAGCTETEEEKQVPEYETTTIENKFAANVEILLKGEEYSPAGGFYKPGNSVSTEHFPLFNDAAIIGETGAQVKGSKYPNCLNITRKNHPSETLFTCRICRKLFPIEENLNDHMIIHSEDRRYNCDRCGKVFERKECLEKHICVQTRNKRYSCENCERTFKRKYHLKRHLRIHTSDKRYKCDICEKKFKSNYKLQRHIRTHTGEKPYKCEYCGMAFNQKSNLKPHTLCHTGEKPYKCEYCERTFRDKSNLQRHIRTHTGEKPFKCRI